MITKLTIEEILLISMAAFFVGCCLGVSYFGTDGFFVGAVAGLSSLFINNIKIFKKN